MPTRPVRKRAIQCAGMIAAALLSVSCPAIGSELMGYKGDRLKGSISCVHPNIIDDLIERIGEAENYAFVLRIPYSAGLLLGGCHPDDPGKATGQSYVPHLGRTRGRNLGDRAQLRSR